MRLEKKFSLLVTRTGIYCHWWLPLSLLTNKAIIKVVTPLVVRSLVTTLLVLTTFACSGRSFEILLEKLPEGGGGASPDTTPPTVPADLAAANAGGATVRLTWAPSRDNVTPQAAIVYEICQTTTSGNCSGGSFQVTYSVTGQTSYTTSPLSNGTTYFFTIRAKDSSGNISAISLQVRTTAATMPQWQQTAYIKAPNTEGADFFGNAVAISGDIIVVAAYGEDSSATSVMNAPFGSFTEGAPGAGAAYVFERDSGGNWQQKAYLKAPNAETVDEFGYSVAVSGATIVVGAYYEDSNSTTVCNAPFSACAGLSNDSAADAGAAYVFERDASGNWQQKAYLKAPNTGDDDQFGYSVAISGDIIVVGALYEDSDSTAVCNEFTSDSCDNAGGDGPNNENAQESGAAYVFERDTAGNWQQKAYLKAPNAEIQDNFGVAVAVSGNTIVVGANQEFSNSTTVCNAPLSGCAGLNNNSTTNAGAAYVFERDSAGNWQQKAYLKAPNPDTNDNFGLSVAIRGDVIVVNSYHEDSNSTAVCNAPFGTCAGLSNESDNQAGAAYVFERDTAGNWQQKAYLKAPNTQAGDSFGYSLAVSGFTIVVGAINEDSISTTVCNNLASCPGLVNDLANEAGAAYVFERDSGGNWQQTAYLKAPNTEGNDKFGRSVAISGDTIVVGAYWEDSNSTAVCNNLMTCPGLGNNFAVDAGAAYVFERK